MPGHLGHGDPRLPDRLGGVAVGDHPVDDSAVQLVQARELIECLCNLSVSHRLGGVRARGPRLGYAPVSGVWLVLPTYNEAENIGPLIGAALSELEKTGLSHRVLVVDDCSPDGTGELADDLAAADSRVQVLHREHKEGLGRAYLAGFGVALAGGAELVVEMDSD